MKRIQSNFKPFSKCRGGIKLFLIASILFFGKVAKAQYDSSIVGLGNLIIEEQTTVKFSTITQIYWRFNKMPKLGTTLEVWKSGTLLTVKPLDRLNIVLEVPTGSEYQLKVDGKIVDEVDARIIKPKEQMSITGDLMSTLSFDQEYLAGTQSLLNAMDENPHISYFEKLAIVQAHYIKGLPLDDIYRLKPEEISTYGFYRKVTDLIFGEDPYEGTGKIIIGHLAPIQDQLNWPQEGSSAGSTPEGTMWGISSLGGPPYILIVRNGVWRLFDYKKDCNATITVKRSAYATNVPDGNYNPNNSPYEHHNLTIDPSTIKSDKTADVDELKLRYFENREHLVMGASAKRFMVQHGNPKWPYGKGPENKENTYADIKSPNIQFMMYNLLSTSKYYASVCACEIPVTISPIYEGYYKMESKILSPGGQNNKSSHVQVLDYAITQVTDLATGEVLHLAAGYAEGAMKCSRTINPEWVNALSDVATNYANVAVDIAVIAAKTVLMDTSVLSNLKNNSLGKLYGAATRLFYTNKFLFPDVDCGVREGNYSLIPPTTHFNAKLKPNHALQMSIASGQKMELRGHSHWESKADLNSRAAIGVAFPELGSTISSVCCSKAHAGWLQTALTATNSSVNLSLLQSILRPMTIWDTKYVGGPFSDLVCFGNYSKAFGKSTPVCSSPVFYFKKAPIIDINNAENREFEVFPNPAKHLIYFKTNLNGRLEIYNTLGQLIQQKQIAGSSNADMDVSEIPNGNYICKFLSEGNEVITKKIQIIH